MLVGTFVLEEIQLISLGIVVTLSAIVGQTSTTLSHQMTTWDPSQMKVKAVKKSTQETDCP